MVSEEHITAFGWATPQEIDDIMALAIRVNDFLSGLFLGVGIRLVDFKMESGRLWEGEMMRIVVADEISPDSCRLWDIKTKDKLDKDRFRRDMGGLVEAYQEVARRLGILTENEKPDTERPAPRAVSAGRDRASAAMPGLRAGHRRLRLASSVHPRRLRLPAARRRGRRRPARLDGLAAGATGWPRTGLEPRGDAVCERRRNAGRASCVTSVIGREATRMRDAVGGRSQRSRPGSPGSSPEQAAPSGRQTVALQAAARLAHAAARRAIASACAVRTARKIRLRRGPRRRRSASGRSSSSLVIGEDALAVEATARHGACATCSLRRGDVVSWRHSPLWR